jgi:Na+/H+-dicarboxylate symporter
MTTNTKLSLTARILIAMALGLLVGVLIRLIIGDQPDAILQVGTLQLGLKSILVDSIFHAGGQIFLASLKMLVVPLVLVSLVCGTASLKDVSTLGRIGRKSMGLFILTTALAIAIAIVFALIVSPGVGVNMPTDAKYTVSEIKSVTQVFIDMFPTNPIDAMAKGEMLQIIVFAVLFGLAITLSGSVGERIRLFFEDLNVVVMKLVEIVMHFSPYGVFFLMAKLFTTLELKNLENIGEYFAVVFFALIFHAFVVYGAFVMFAARLNPLTFFKKMRETAMFAFSTASSNATVASNLATTTHKLGVSNKVSSFTVPLGATINMDGTAIMQGVATVFIAQVYNIDLSTSDYLMVILTATLASIGTAGVPGVGLVMLAMVLEQVGIPIDGIALILGIDRLLDMTRTAVNVTGDAMVSCLVAKSEGVLDEKIYNDPKAGRLE